MNNQTQSTSKLIFTALFCCLLWGSAPVLIKTGYEAFQVSDTPSILLFAGFRFILAGLMVLIFAFGSSRKSGSNVRSSGFLKAVFALAMFQTFGQYSLYYIGVANTSGVIASILSGVSAFFALAISSWIYHLEKMTPVKAFSCLLGFLGILIMNLKGFQLSFSFSGEGVLLLSQICSAESAVLIKIFSRKQDPVLLSGFQFLLGGLLLSLSGLFGGGHLQFSLSGMWILLMLGFVSAGAYTLWGVLLSEYPVSKVGIFTCTIPLFGVLFSILFLKEYNAFNFSTLMALLLIGFGIYLLNAPGKSRTHGDSESSEK